jgi:hypothetical protein
MNGAAARIPLGKKTLVVPFLLAENPESKRYEETAFDPCEMSIG